MSNNTIKDGVVVSIAYKLTSEGMEIEHATADEPLDYLHGAENIVPGLERELTGKKVGDKFSVTLQPEDAYGEYDEEEVEVLDRDELPDDLEIGTELLLEDEDGFMFSAYVKEIYDDEVVLDFNDPLAGKVITYDVEVLALRDADEEELAHGHPHGTEDEYDEYE